jgi:glycosyltransferase involved in cell wall biosynthesis
MRILVATDQWSPDVVGGSARVAADSAHALADRGHEVVVLAPARHGLPEVEPGSGLEIRRVLRQGRIPRTVADPVRARHHARLLRDRPFDVLLAHQATNAVGLGAAGLEVPLAFVFHASAVLEMQYLRRRSTGASRAVAFALEPALVALERAAIRSARSVLVLSRFSERIVTGRHPQAAKRLRVVGGGVDRTFFERRPDADETRSRLGIPPGALLLTARRLEPRMGVDILIDAVARIRDDQVVLAVAGSGSMQRALERKVVELGLADRVRLLGQVPEATLRNLYAAADLFVLPTVAHEGFGMATVEALAAGTPVLGTAVGATPEILGDLGPEFLVGRADPDALAEAIRKLLPALGPELRARARRLASDHYRWDAAIVAWETALAGAARG